MSASRKKRARRFRRKALEAAAAAPIEDAAWVRIGAWCSAHRRSAWMRVVMTEVAPGCRPHIERLELRAGREGDDVVLIIDRSNPQFEALYDLFTTMRFAVES